MKAKLIILTSILGMLSACEPYYRDSYARYPDRYGRTDEHGFGTVGPHTDFGDNYARDRRDGYYSNSDEARRHEHMAAERRHLEEEEREDRERHRSPRF
jgi:hypothetical protein